jgi:hypothetical protein
LSQQLAHIEQTPFYGVFIDLKKAFDAMDRERCLFLLEGHGAGPNMRRLIRHFWDEATNVCRASGNYGAPFKAGRGVTQGGLLSAKLFNVLVDAVVREWLRLLREEMEMEEEEMEGMMETLFAIFYVDDAYIASRDPVFLQQAIDGLVSTFKRVGLKTNIKKTQAMTCTPGTFRLQLPTESYLRMRTGWTPAADWDARTVTCRECRKDMRVSSLGRHLADQHQIYQQQVVAEELLNRREGVVYKVPLGCGKLKCPFPLCKGELASGWNKLLNKLSQFLLCTKWIDEGLFDCRDLHHSKVATGRREHLPDGNVSPFGNNPAKQISGWIASNRLVGVYTVMVCRWTDHILSLNLKRKDLSRERQFPH